MRVSASRKTENAKSANWLNARLGLVISIDISKYTLISAVIAQTIGVMESKAVASARQPRENIRER